MLVLGVKIRLYNGNQQIINRRVNTNPTMFDLNPFVKLFLCFA